MALRPLTVFEILDEILGDYERRYCLLDGKIEDISDSGLYRRCLEVAGS